MLGNQSYVVETNSGLRNLGVSNADVAKALLLKVDGHADGVDSFSPLELDIAKYPFQDLTCTHVRGENAGPDTLRKAANDIYPGATHLISAFRERRELLESIAEAANEGQNFAVLTDHSSVKGTLIGGLSLACALYEEKLVEPEDIEVALLASQMIKFTSLEGSLPTSEVLPGLLSYTFYTDPDTTDDNPELRVLDEIREPVNKAVIRAYLKLLGGDKSVFSIIAGSGRTDVSHIDADGNETIHYGPMNPATTKLVTWMGLVNLGIDVSTDTPEFFIGDFHPISEVRADDIGPILMKQTASGMSDITGTLREYHSSSDRFLDIKMQAERAKAA